MFKYAYLNNLPSPNLKAIKGGMRGIYKKYFVKSIPELNTDRHSILPELYKHPERKHTLNKLDVDGDYLASYTLQVKLDKFVNEYNFEKNFRDIYYLKEQLEQHFSKILNDSGKTNLYINVGKYHNITHQNKLYISICTKDSADFKPNTPHNGMELMRFNFTDGQYYYN